MPVTPTVRLNQLIAVRQGVQADAHAKISRLHHDVQKAPLLSGISRAYKPRYEEDPGLPSESTHVQVRANRVLLELRDVLTRSWDLTAAVDYTNCQASADVVVDGQVLMSKVPAPHLLFLEKQLKDVRTILSKLPTLDPAELWRWDDNTDAWASVPTETTRTRKIHRNHEVSPATDKHPAQVQVFQEDEIVGYWTTTKFSGAMPAARVRELVDRVTTLRDAVKQAREQANMSDVTDPKPYASVFEWLLRH